MELPSILPAGLKELEIATNDRELFERLVYSTEMLIQFFSYAADDETWSSKHAEFYRLALNAITYQYLNNRLSTKYAKIIVKAFHEHYGVLSDFLPRLVFVCFNDQRVAINPLIAGVMSSYLKNLFLKEESKNTYEIYLEQSDDEITTFALHYLETFHSEDLWRFEKPKIKGLLILAEKWEILALKIECEEVLRRYVNVENVQKQLVLSLRKERLILLEKCIEIFNQKFPKTILTHLGKRNLSLEFLDFDEEAKEAFNTVKEDLTHLVFKGNIASDKRFLGKLLECPKLIGIGLKNTEEWNPQFLEIPSCVNELDISECNWLTDSELRHLCVSVSHITVLHLAQNTQLTYRGFAELKRLTLKSLDIARCYQLDNESLNLILQGAVGLEELNLYGCRKLTDAVFYEIGRKIPDLKILKISRTVVTDGGLIDIGVKCKNLETLELNHCINITEAGLDDFLKKAKGLKKISLEDNRLHMPAIEAWKTQYVNLNILI